MIKFKHTDNKGLEAKTNEGFGLIIISQQVTEGDHENIKNSLNEFIKDNIRVDIFFKWSNTSIIIFDTKFINSKLRKSINSVLSNIKHAVLFNGVFEGSNTLTDIYISNKPDCIQVSKKFLTLLTLRKVD